MKIPSDQFTLVQLGILIGSKFPDVAAKVMASDSLTDATAIINTIDGIHVEKDMLFGDIQKQIDNFNLHTVSL